jgi:hypothetical protein
MNCIKCSESYILLYKEISALPSHNLQVCGVSIVAALSTPFVTLKAFNCRM